MKHNNAPTRHPTYSGPDSDGEFSDPGYDSLPDLDVPHPPNPHVSTTYGSLDDSDGLSMFKTGPSQTKPAPVGHTRSSSHNDGSATLKTRPSYHNNGSAPMPTLKTGQPDGLSTLKMGPSQPKPTPSGHTRPSSHKDGTATLMTGQVQPTPAPEDTTRPYSRHDTPASMSTLQTCRPPALETTFPLEALRGHLATVHSDTDSHSYHDDSSSKDSLSAQTNPVDHADANSSDDNMDVSVDSRQVKGSVSFASDHIGFLPEDQVLEREAEKNLQIRAEKRKKTKV